MLKMDFSALKKTLIIFGLKSENVYQKHVEEYHQYKYNIFTKTCSIVLEKNYEKRERNVMQKHTTHIGPAFGDQKQFFKNINKFILYTLRTYAYICKKYPKISSALMFHLPMSRSDFVYCIVYTHCHCEVDLTRP